MNLKPYELRLIAHCLDLEDQLRRERMISDIAMGKTSKL